MSDEAKPPASSGAVAARLGLPRWKLAYYIERGDVPGPSVLVTGRRLFTEEDISRIKAALASLPDKKRAKHRDKD